MAERSACCVGFVLALLVLGQTRLVRAEHDDDDAKYLYVWAGHVDHAIAGSATAAFDTSPQGGMPQILQVTRDGSRLLTGLFQSGRILMLDTTNRSKLEQVTALDLGAGAGPHNLMLTEDDSRLIVTDYFLVEDNFPFANPGKVQLDGDHKVHVVKVKPHSLKLDTRFNLDFDTAFPTDPARPHGIAVR